MREAQVAKKDDGKTALKAEKNAHDDVELAAKALEFANKEFKDRA